jgi:hypothetical protein
MVLVVAFDTSFASSVGQFAYLLSFVGPPVLIPSSSTLLPLHETLPVLHSECSKSTIDSLLCFCFFRRWLSLWWYSSSCVVSVL